MVASYLIFISILSLSRNQDSDIYCNTAFECAISSTNAGMVDIWNDGYKSHTGSSSVMTTSSTVACQGAFSCTNAHSIVAQFASCMGSLSCSKVTSIQLTGSLGAIGVNAMSYSHISVPGVVDCRGEQSCAYSYITGFTTLLAYGAYSLLNATLDSISLDEGGTMEIYLNGYYAAFGATIICRSGHWCWLFCSGNACVNLHLVCDGSCFNSADVSVTTLSIHDLWAYDSLKMEEANDAACSAQIDNMTFDNSHERKDVLDLFTNEYDGPICCRGYQACFQNSFSVAGGYAVVCSGMASCYGSTMHNLVGSVFCGGYSSCYDSNIVAKTAYCSAYGACYTANIIASDIYCTGYQSCRSASISTVFSSNRADLNLYLYGFQSGMSAEVTCGALDHCSIFCYGTEGCVSLVLKCYGNCTVYCDADSLCPIMYNRTLNPSAFPSSEPSMNPSAFPSSEPSMNPSVNPSSVQSIPPTSVLINPTLRPTLVIVLPSPTKEPIMESTISLTDTIVTIPSTDEVSGNNAVDVESYLWIIAVVVGICLVLCVIISVVRVQRKDTEAQDSEIRITEMTEDVIVASIKIKKDEDRDITELIEWLTSKVKLPRYVPNFADNGYETMQFVRDISTTEQLEEIGIMLKGHQVRILAALKKLKAGPQQNFIEKDHMVVKVKQKQHRQGHKPQRSLLNELEGENEKPAPLTSEGSPPRLNNNDVFDIQGGVTLSSFPEDQQLDDQTVPHNIKYVFDNDTDVEVFGAREIAIATTK